MQTHSDSVQIYPSIVYSIRHIYQHEGLRGFYRGLGAGVTQVTPLMYVRYLPPSIAANIRSQGYFLRHLRRCFPKYPPNA